MRTGRHLLQIPGPTNLPDRVLRALGTPLIDHRSDEFTALAADVREGLRSTFRTEEPVVVLPASGTGAWEAALVNTLSLGDKVIAFDHGYFALQWASVARRLGLEVDLVPVDWRRPVDPDTLEARLRAVPEAKAVLVVHNETSTGVTNDVAAIRQAIGDHPALLQVDVISSLASMPYDHDAWGADVSIGASQKGLMLPPGLGFNVAGERARAAAGMRRAYWSWDPYLAGEFPYTPAVGLLLALREALDMLHEHGLEAIAARHAHHARAAREAVRAWGLDVYCADDTACSTTVTGALVAENVDADELRAAILHRSDVSLGAGLGRLRGRVFRIGHLGDLNDTMLCGALAGIELGLRSVGLIRGNGLQAAVHALSEPSPEVRE